MRCAAAVSQRARGSGWAAAGVSKESETGASLPMNSRRLRRSTTKTAELAERCRSDQEQMQMQQMGREAAGYKGGFGGVLLVTVPCLHSSAVT
jgi:hypothetical protein